MKNWNWLSINYKSNRTYNSCLFWFNGTMKSS